MRRLPWVPVLAGLLGVGLGPAHDAAPPRASGRFTNSVGMKFVRLPAGVFLMGSPRTEPGRYVDEDLHPVEITRPFYLGAYEVTQEQYRKVMGKNPSWFAPSGKGKDRVKGTNTSPFPVERVSWHDASAFCARLSALPGERKARRVYRLPTEAEWEYACRAGCEAPEPGPFQFGNDLSSTQANFNGNVPYGKGARGPYLRRPAPVGSYRASRVGLFDMHGNVWEWCADWYGKDYYREGPRKDPPGPASGDYRVIRGGSWLGEGRLCRAAHRLYSGPAARSNLIGFRVACDPPGGRR